MWFLAPKNFSAKSVKIWPKYVFQAQKRVKNVVFGPEKMFSQIGQRMAKKCFLGPKRVENVVFGPEKFFSQIGRKMAEIWPKDIIQVQKGSKMWFWPRNFFSAKSVKKWPKDIIQAKKRSKMWFFATPKNSAKMVKKWLKHGQKMFSRPKRIEKVVLGLKKIRSNWSENGQNMATHTHTHTYTHTHVYFVYLQRNSVIISLFFQIPAISNDY